MHIYVNSAPYELQAGSSVRDLISLLGLESKRIAVEMNQELVPRSRFQDQLLSDQDRIELIHAVGGG